MKSMILITFNLFKLEQEGKIVYNFNKTIMIKTVRSITALNSTR